MRSVVLALILVWASASMVQAGAWLRGKGSGFASSSVSTNQSRDISTSVYLEYGLSETITLGADISYGVDRVSFPEGSGILFLRFPLGPTDRTHKWAAHVGVGARYLTGEFLPAAELGLSWGRGIQIGQKYGWVNVDTSFNEPQSPAEQRIKLDGTVGLSLTRRTKVMFQMFNTLENGETFSKLAPSLLFSPGKGTTTLQLSAEVPVAGGGETAIKVGIWREF
ncbi:hypothetical protein [Roseobacter weihaiensis]|uniref:hypothetical protein n=1 Tax=Roseobacter weihaiensis TaxID=2763262 RepID=UPI001D0B96C2|nr:hypothetical protein [Roseobacter sp. H9]